jgi:transposase
MFRTEVSKLFEVSLKSLRKTRIPEFSCKFSKKTYTQHQLLALLVLKSYMNFDYRRTCQIAEELLPTFEILNLSKVPHFTTLQKFFCRIPNRWLGALLTRVLHHFEAIKYLAIDSTGLSADRTSKYYSVRIGKGVWSSHFLKMSVLLDVKRRLPVAACFHNRARHDVRDFLPLLKKVRKPVKYFVADKAYDFEKIFAALKERKIKAIIPLRFGWSCVNGRCRRRMIEEWASNPAIERQYHQRSLIESFFSAVKRRLGEEVRSRLWHLQRREAMMKVVVYSMLQQGAALLLIEVFYRARRLQLFLTSCKLRNPGSDSLARSRTPAFQLTQVQVEQVCSEVSR